jgi:7-keto-8-aminopelargonate synthetase-like enzyme
VRPDDRGKRNPRGGHLSYFHALESRQDVEVMMEGKRRIMLGSNNYLGSPRIRKSWRRDQGDGAIRLRLLRLALSQRHAPHASGDRAGARALFEQRGGRDLLTGFQSNLGIISAIVGKGDYVICDKENHASIYDGCKLSYGTMVRYRHADMEHLRHTLEQIPDTAGKLIVTDGVFSMGGDIANLPEIVKLAKEFGARVMVDDAHGLGVLGKGGRGTASHFGLEDEVDIYMGTFSKSLASLGGYMASSLEVAEFVRHTSRPFIFSASMTPASCACALAALRILEREPERVSRLQEICRYVRAGLTERGIPHKYTADIPIIPIYTYETIRTLTIAKMLYEAGVYVNPVLPPATPATECLLRTSYMATLKEPLLDEAMDIMASVLTEEAK